MAVSVTGAMILVVDDNEMNRDVLSRRLEKQGHHVVTAEDGQRALQLSAEHQFDLILLDIMMPKMNGYQVLEHLKADPKQHHVPVIVVSALDELESVVKCIELGAEDYLFKPFNPVLLKARIAATLEKQQHRRRSVQPYTESLSEKLNALLSGSAGPVSGTQRQLLEEMQALLDTMTQIQ